MLVPTKPKIYHITPIDRLVSIVADAHLWSDAEIQRRNIGGTTIGMNDIKKRRLTELTLECYPDLYVGDCVPFYFCPRSIMLYKIFMANDPNLEYRGGQEPVVHLVADLRNVVAWANHKGRRWAFTTSNAGSRYFEDFNDLKRLAQIDWQAVHARYWSDCKFGKQAEFLVEQSFPWRLVSGVGVHSVRIRDKVRVIARSSSHRPPVQVMRGWYY